MKFKTKSGEEITTKEFMKRWKRGIQSINPLQQTLWQVRSTWIMLIGVVLGIVISFINIKTLWWLLIILIGAFGNTVVQLIAVVQKRNILQNIEGGSEDGF